MARIYIPTPLRIYVDNHAALDVNGSTVGEALDDLVSVHPKLKQHLYDDAGELRSFVNIYRNDDDIRYLDREQTTLGENDELSIVPSIAGGADTLTETIDPPGPARVAAAARGETLSSEEIRRYSRHLTLPEFGMEGQKKLKASSVFLVGAGGLGSPLALYLAAAGVGRIGIVDFDVVDETNLQRQVIHGTKDVGRKKLDSARDRIKDINPLVEVETFDVALSSENALDILKDYDVVADGTDNFPTRYLVNDACVLLGIPNVYASIFRFEGQVSVFGMEDGPCYRCVYEQPPPPGLVPSCADGGVLGVLPGLVGTLQATEVIKVLTGIGEPLIGRLLMIDALDMKFRTLKIRKNPDCPVCGDHPTQTELIDYQEFCGIPQASNGQEEVSSNLDISVHEYKEMRERGEEPFVLDVRKPYEAEICTLGGTLIPVDELEDRLDELDEHRNEDIVVYCRSGARSGRAVEMMRSYGFSKAVNLAGGVLAWSDEIDPSMPKY
jgi:adenylyltransferase/sulfurtransferase